MNHRILVLVLSTSMAALGLAHCSSDDSTKNDGGSDASSQPDTSKSDGSTTDAAGGGAQLKVKNFLSWCDVSVNGGAASATATQTVTVTPGTIPLSMTAGAGFILGDWHHTTGDQGSGDPGTVSNGTSTTSVDVDGGGACVWVCCPFPDGGGCPSADQCP